MSGSLVIVPNGSPLVKLGLAFMAHIPFRLRAISWNWDTLEALMQALPTDCVTVLAALPAEDIAPIQDIPLSDHRIISFHTVALSAEGPPVEDWKLHLPERSFESAWRATLESTGSFRLEPL